MRWTNCWKCNDNKSGLQIRAILKIKRLFLIKIILNPVEKEKSFILFNIGLTNKK